MDFTTFTNFVNGKPRGSNKSYHGVNPSTEEALWDVPLASEEDLNDAVNAARGAFPAWSATPFETRCRLIKEYSDALRAHEEEFTNLIMKETGKPRDMASRELLSSCESITGTTTFTLPEDKIEDETKTAITRHVPLGVAAAICPWNFPLVLLASKIAPALVAGCCMIVKPSPFTPYSSLKFVEAGQKIFPPGVLQILGGDDKLGPSMVSHPGIQKISFTGSVNTGKRVLAAATQTMKRVTLELGGNDAAIVCPDVDIAKVAPVVCLSAFKNTGQICVASKRIYVHEDIYQPFLKAMADFTKKLKVGNPFDEGTDLGPIQNGMQFDRVQEFFDDCEANGYEFVAGGRDCTPHIGKGYFIQPTIVANPPTSSKIMGEEPFGPIVPVQPWKEETDVVRRANDTKVGLGATVWGKDIERAERIARQLEVGSVFINSVVRPDWRVFFSGHKESGVGGEKGLQGILQYCNTQAVHTYK